MLLCQHFYPEMISTGMHMTELSQALTKLGWEIEVVCAQPSLQLEAENAFVPRQIRFDGIRITRVSTIGSHKGGIFGRLCFGVTYAMSTASIAVRRAAQFDILITTTNPPFIGLIAWLTKVVRALPYIVIVYDVYPDIAVRLGILRPSSPLVWMWERVTRLILSYAAATVVIGRDMAEIVSAKCCRGLRRLVCIPNWSDENTVRPIPRQQNQFRREEGLDGMFVVQYSGRMGRTHNLEPLLEAAELLEREEVIFQLIGDGAKKQKLQAMAERLRLRNVRFLPYQPLTRLAQVLSSADLAVVCLDQSFTGMSVPSKTYGVMAAGVPILGFLDPKSEIGLTIAETECGIVLAEPSGRAVADIVLQLLRDPPRLKSMGERGLAAFRANYTLSSAAQKYDRLLQSIAIGRSPEDV